MNHENEFYDTPFFTLQMCVSCEHPQIEELKKLCIWSVAHEEGNWLFEFHSASEYDLLLLGFKRHS